jgi:hypothetical protein
MTTRIRTRQGFVNLITHTVTDTVIPGLNLTRSGLTGDNTNETMSDEVTSSFGPRIRNGEVINNPCSYVKERVYGGGATSWNEHKFTNPVRTIHGSGGSIANAYINIYPTSSISEPARIAIPSGFIHKAKLQALANIDKTPYSFAEDVAEFHQTLGFLREPFKAMRNLSELFFLDIKRIEKFRRKNKRGALGVLLNRGQLIADAWAEYRFAFSPLLRSGLNLINSISVPVERPSRRSARGKSTYALKTSVDTLRQSIFKWTADSSVDSEIRAQILYEHSNPINDWKFKYGLRNKDIPVTYWAIMPYSFMVDRMVDVSSSLRAITNFLDPQVKILAGSVTYRNSYMQKRTLNGSISPSGWTYSHPSSFQCRETFEYLREVWVPTAYDLYPTVDVGGIVDGSTKIADLAALIIQRLK